MRTSPTIAFTDTVGNAGKITVNSTTNTTIVGSISSSPDSYMPDLVQTADANISFYATASAEI